MSEFLSAEWLTTLNDSLALSPPPLEREGVFRLVLEVADGPSAAAHALTVTLSRERSFAEYGDHLAADAVVRLSYRDARDLVAGTLTSAEVLRAGRLKVRGDVPQLVQLLPWFTAVTKEK